MAPITPSNYWITKLTRYQDDKWSQQPNIFAQLALKYFPNNSHILELGCGNGQDAFYFGQNGHSVIATDFVSTEAVNKLPINFQLVDLTNTFPFQDKFFNVVYAHLSLHFFNHQATHDIFQEINRVLKKGGLLAILLNNINDPEIKGYNQLEKNLFQDPNGIAKSYFSIKTLKPFITEYKALLFDESGVSYKDQAKGINNLVRFIGTKL